MIKKRKETYKLNLSDKSITSITEDILKYPNLKELDLRNNHITEIPEFLTRLKYLEVLLLRNNKIIVAPELLLQFRALRVLTLPENKITKIPESYSALTQLEKFDIGSNPLTEFPEWLWRLYKLKDLGIYDLNLEHLPQSVTKISSLETLSLDGNNLTTLPDSIENLRQLKWLWAEGNCFEKLPESFGNLRSLKIFNLSVNKIKNLPESVANLRNLEAIHIGENKLQALPKNIGNLKKLTTLDVSYNQLKELPVSFSNLILSTLDFWVEGNQFNDETIARIKKLIPDIDESDFEPIETKKEDSLDTKINQPQHIKQAENNDVKTETIDSNSYNWFQFKIYSILILVLAAPFLLSIIFKKQDPIAKAIEKANNDYSKVYNLYQENENKILKETEYLYVFTNDTNNLKATIRPNIDYYVNEYAMSYQNLQWRANELNDFLQNKSKGYDILLNNNRVRFYQGKLFDSIIPEKAPKKYKLVVDYKLTQQELDAKKRAEKKRKYRLYSKDKDSLHDTYGIVITTEELKNKTLESSLKKLLMPKIDLENKNFFFYFSPYDGSLTKQEFIAAIEDFKIMFLKDKKLNKNFTIKKLKIEKTE
ncbi:leucine-rich repeat domain-containing protein [Algibacter sp. L1A34]|uniref:leucine-rich repeat domain-containing protein n=1 Tax=Algibacter sp. L1A34 TaxID=2686365 RepID=UPI00131B5F25|nr:leucine-rich repeat domain-containing protein [Algibacter sp. L1A34]